MPNFEPHCRCPGCGECDAHEREPKLKQQVKALKARVAELETAFVDLLDDAALEHETRKYGVYQIGHDTMTAAQRIRRDIKRATDSADAHRTEGT